MRRNLNYIYKLLMSYPRLTAGGLIFLFAINFFDMAYWKNYGIMNALFGAITYVFLALILKIVWFSFGSHRKLSNLEPTPVLFVVMTVLILVVIMLLVAVPSLYNIHNIRQLKGI